MWHANIKSTVRESKRRRKRIGRSKTKLEFAKDIGSEPLTLTYRVSKQINPVICLIDTRKTQSLRKEITREKNRYLSVQFVFCTVSKVRQIPIHASQVPQKKADSIFNAITRCCASKGTAKALENRKKYGLINIPGSWWASAKVWM